MNPVTRILYPKFQAVVEKLKAWAHPQLWVYDIETYPNFFSLAVINVRTHQCYYFELSPWYNNMQELSKFIYYLNDNRADMVGYNNQHFDWPVLDHTFKMIPCGVTNTDIFDKVRSIFDADFEDRFRHVIWGGQQYVRQIDLFKINHYDNKAKSTSLKQLENNMGMDNIQELPIEPGTNILLESRNDMYLYNWHDIAATLLFLCYNMDKIDLRETLSKKYEHDFTNASDAKLGSDIFKLELNKAGVATTNKTFRDEIRFSECIFDYIQFERPEFKAVRDWLMTVTITKTKECLNDIDVPWSLVRYMNPDEVIVVNLDPMVLHEMKLRKGAKVKLSLVPCGESLNNCSFIATHLHVVVDGFQFDLGTGGLHGSVSSSIVKTNETHTLIDIDAEGYYPSLAEANGVAPEHLGLPFCETTGKIKRDRKKYSKKTHPSENKALKLANNASYGNSNSQYSFLFDPKYTMTITLNGQLLLCLMSQELLKVPGLSIIQVNTDGITYLCPKAYVEHTSNLCRWWETRTGLIMEEVTYHSMFIRDVNNYIAIDEDGERKHKGAYKSNFSNDEWHKNFNQRIVGKTAEAVLCDGVDPAEYINRFYGKDEYRELFCMSSKVDRASRCVFMLDGVETELQRITRYYASYDGGDMIKIMKPTKSQCVRWLNTDHYRHESTGAYETKDYGKKPSSGRYKLVPIEERSPTPPDRRLKIEATCKIQPCNNLSDFDWDNLSIEYYLNEVDKLVAPLLQQC